MRMGTPVHCVQTVEEWAVAQAPVHYEQTVRSSPPAVVDAREEVRVGVHHLLEPRGLEACPRGAVVVERRPHLAVGCQILLATSYTRILNPRLSYEVASNIFQATASRSTNAFETSFLASNGIL